MFFKTYYKLFHTSHSSCTSVCSPSIAFVEQKAMRSAVLNCLIFVIEFPFSITLAQDPDDSYLLDQKVLSRKKRYLNFPEGSILQVSTYNKKMDVPYFCSVE